MSVVNSLKARFMQELKKEFPRMQKLEDIADVLIIGQELGAIDEANRKKKWDFVRKGAKGTAVYRAYRPYRLLDKKQAKRRAFVMYMRGGNLKNDVDTRNALSKERRGLYAHLLVSATARTVVANVLGLPTNSLFAIRRALESGTVQEQLIKYDKAVNQLILEKIYDKSYDYYWMGFRFLPDKYWLSKTALMLLSRAR